MKKNLLNEKTVATWYGGSLWYGAAIKWVNDKKIGLVEYAANNKIPHILKVYYNLSGEPYFILNGQRVKLNDCIRTNLL